MWFEIPGSDFVVYVQEPLSKSQYQRENYFVEKNLFLTLLISGLQISQQNFIK